MMRKHLLTAAMCLAAVAATAQGFKNPVIPGYYPDPSVCRVGDDFYLVNSTFQFFPGVPVWHSKDLVNWEQIGNVLDRESQVDLSAGGASSGIFAPTIRYHDGLYYMITTNINMMFNRKPGNFIVTATDPAGPWSEPVFVEGAMGIDPSLFWEGDKCYLTWSMNGISMAEVDTKTGKLLSDTRTIWMGEGGSSPEGPHLYKKDGYYYLMIAEGGTEMGHRVTIARSRNIWGPYEGNPANPILTQQSRLAVSSLLQGTGHADLVQAADGSWWMVFLGFRTSAGKQLHTLGRETNLAPVIWPDGGWPVVNGDGRVDINMKAQTLPLKPFEAKPVRTDFGQLGKLGFEWIYINNPKTENYAVGKGGLELKASSVSIDDPRVTPTFVARRQQDINCTVTTEVSLRNGKSGDQAGLTVYMDPKGHYDLYVTAGHRVELRYKLGEMSHVEKSVSVGGSAVQLRCEASATLYKFSYSTDGGKTFRDLGQMDTRFLATETLGGFTGVLFGLYAEGGNGTHATATFPWFDYQPGEPYVQTSMY